MSEEHKGASFEARLQSAREKHGLGSPSDGVAPAQNPAAAPSGSALGVGMRAGLEVVSALGVAVAIGWGLDHWLHTLPLFLVIFMLLGGVAGVMNVWRLVGPGSH